MLVIALVVFFVLFFIVRSYKECNMASSNGGGFAGSDYSNKAFLDSATRELNPVKSRLSGVFRWTSPESWPFPISNPSAAINASHRGRVTASPHVMTETPAFIEVPESY